MINGVNIGCHIELKLGLLMTKGQLEVDVVCARGIRAEDSPPGKYDNNVIRFIRVDPFTQKLTCSFQPSILK